MATLTTDGSSLQDARQTVTIDLDSANDRWRFKCPNNHTSWEPTNGGIWCRSCSNAGLDPHYHRLLDTREKCHIDWQDVQLR